MQYGWISVRSNGKTRARTARTCNTGRGVTTAVLLSAGSAWPGPSKNGIAHTCRHVSTRMHTHATEMAYRACSTIHTRQSAVVHNIAQAPETANTLLSSNEQVCALNTTSFNAKRMHTLARTSREQKSKMIARKRLRRALRREKDKTISSVITGREEQHASITYEARSAAADAAAAPSERKAAEIKATRI